jgi:chromosome segregation ATPase
LQTEVDKSQSAGGQLVAGAKGVIDDLSAQLGATSQDLEQTQQELDDSKQATADAEQAAETAKDAADTAGNQTDKLQAEADQAKAEVQAAEGKAAIAADCAKAYVSGLSSALAGEGADVREQLQAITADCKTALADA